MGKRDVLVTSAVGVLMRMAASGKNHQTIYANLVQSGLTGREIMRVCKLAAEAKALGASPQSALVPSTATQRKADVDRSDLGMRTLRASASTENGSAHMEVRVVESPLPAEVLVAPVDLDLVATMILREDLVDNVASAMAGERGFFELPPLQQFRRLAEQGLTASECQEAKRRIVLRADFLAQMRNRSHSLERSRL